MRKGFITVPINEKGIEQYNYGVKVSDDFYSVELSYI